MYTFAAKKYIAIKRFKGAVNCDTHDYQGLSKWRKEKGDDTIWCMAASSSIVKMISSRKFNAGFGSSPSRGYTAIDSSMY